MEIVYWNFDFCLEEIYTQCKYLHSSKYSNVHKGDVNVTFPMRSEVLKTN